MIFIDLFKTKSVESLSLSIASNSEVINITAEEN